MKRSTIIRSFGDDLFLFTRKTHNDTPIYYACALSVGLGYCSEKSAASAYKDHRPRRWRRRFPQRIAAAGSGSPAADVVLGSSGDEATTSRDRHECLPPSRRRVVDGAVGGRPVRPVRSVPGLGRRAIADGVDGSAVLRARRPAQRQRRGQRARSAVVRAHGERHVDGQGGARVLQADGGVQPRRRGRADAERAGRGCRARRRPGHRVRRVVAMRGCVQSARRRPTVRQSVVQRRPAQRRRRR